MNGKSWIESTGEEDLRKVRPHRERDPGVSDQVTYEGGSPTLEEIRSLVHSREKQDS